MDKTWMKVPIQSQTYKYGAKSFIDFARKEGDICCPCMNCCLQKWLDCDTVHGHILVHGFLPGYTTWTFHGELMTSTQYDTPYMRKLESRSKSTSVQKAPLDTNNILKLLEDVMGPIHGDREMGQIEETDHHEGANPLPNKEAAEFLKLLEESNQELYKGSSYSRLAFILQLYHIKCLGGIANKYFDMLLELLSDAFPFLNSLPSKTYEVKKMTHPLGLDYEKIEVCPNNCMLYWGPREKDTECYVCLTKKPEKPKLLRYFPLIPRLRRLYSSSKTAKDMRWHFMDRTKDGKLRHPTDGLAWKDFDDRYPDFASDARSVRLALSSDGVSPNRTMSTTYSVWPVMLIPYNLPPWLCMKQSSFILSMIIPGPKGPGNDIDVFLQPLIKELQQLWEGVDAYDAFAKEHFNLRAALCGIINDFPAYANLSGWSTKGRVACPSCTSSTHSIWLKNGKKFSYMGHRRWLDLDHPYGFDKDKFDGTVELRVPPIPPSGSDILAQLRGVTFKDGKPCVASNKRGREEEGDMTHDALMDGVNNEPSSDDEIFEDFEDFIEEDIEGEEIYYKKRSIFFDLPYWEHLLLRHSLDVMHIEKNVCCNLLGTLLNLEGKTKDNEKTRKDLEDMGIRHELHLIDRGNKKPSAPLACYTMSPSEKDAFLHLLKNIKVPDGYASNISRGVNLKDRKINNLKSHDGHILMQDLLPIACRASMHSQQQTKVVKVVCELCYIFKALCAKVLDIDELDKLEKQVAKTLCDMEAIFPPSFFTIMVHLVIHLVSEIKLGGPVPYRWMYPEERYMGFLKSHVRNKAQPEGSMAEGYLANECLTFCSRYFDGVETRFNRPQRNDECIIPYKDKYLFNSAGRALGKVDSIQIDLQSLEQAHRYVLLHSDKISPYLEIFLHEKRSAFHGKFNHRVETKWIVEEFPWWLREQVPLMERSNCDKETIAISRGPSNYVKSYKAFILNGFRFHTKDREMRRRTQNSGIMVEVQGEDGGGGSECRNYYGVIKDIYELDYYNVCKVVVFRCDWVNVKSSKGFKLDKYGLPLVSFNNLIHTGETLKDDPFVLSSQVRQVFYVKDEKDDNWFHVVMTKPRDLYDMGEKSQESDDESYTQCMPSNELNIDESALNSGWRRTDVEVENVE